MSPIDIRDRLGDRFRILTSSSRAPQRQQTLRDVVAWSYELLDDDERSLLCATAVFAGGFDLAAITEVWGQGDDLAVLDLVDSLVRKSLVVADNATGTGRYVVLETIRQFVEDELTASGSIVALVTGMPPGSRPRRGALGSLERPGVARLCRLAGGRARQPARRRSSGAGRAVTSSAQRTSPRTRLSWVPRSSCSRRSPGPGAPGRCDASGCPPPSAALHRCGLGLLHRPPGRGGRRRTGRGGAGERPSVRRVRAGDVGTHRSPRPRVRRSSRPLRRGGRARRSAPGERTRLGTVAAARRTSGLGPGATKRSPDRGGDGRRSSTRQPVLRRLRVLDLRQRAPAHRPGSGPGPVA